MDVGGWLRGLGLGAIRGGVPRQRNRRRGAAEADGRRPQGPRRRCRRPSAQDHVRDRGAERRAAARGRSPTTPRRKLRLRRPPTPPSGASSPSCSATSSARPRCRRGSIPRTCARSSAPIRTPARAWWRAMTASSPNSWATACSPISAFPARTRTTRRGRSMRGWKSPRSWRACKPARARSSPCASAIATGLVVVGDIVGPGLGAGAGGRRRHAQSRRAAAGPRRCGRRRRLGRDAAADRRPVPPARISAGTRSRASPSRSRPMRRSACRRARAVSRRRMRRGSTGFVGREAESAELLARQRRAWGGAGPDRADLGRSGHRQVAPVRLARRAGRGYAAHAASLPVLALSSRQRALSLRAAIRARGGHRAAGAARGQARQAGEGARPRDRPHGRGRAADRLDAVDPDRRPLSRAEPLARAAAPPDAFGAPRPDGGPGEEAAAADAVRGRALGRRDLARSARPRDRTGAAAADSVADHLPSGVRSALDGPARRRDDRAWPARSRRGGDAGRARRPADASSPRKCSRRSSPRPTACRCSSKS